MDQAQATQNVVVTNRTGLHARPVHLLVKAALAYQSSIRIVKDGQEADAKSMLDVLTLLAERGTELRLEAQGPDADAAVAAIAKLFADKFGESDEP